MYGKIVFNNVKEFTPSWIKTVKYNQCAKPILSNYHSIFLTKSATGSQKVSNFGSSAKVKALWRLFNQQVCARPAIWQAYIFVSNSSPAI
jgi:hypothetical protein